MFCFMLLLICLFVGLGVFVSNVDVVMIWLVW